MTARSEFPAKVKDAAYARSQGRCENKTCGVVLTTGKFHFDHILPDALGGKPELVNCAVLCTSCHGAKTAREDVPRIRKADRQRRAHIGAKAAPKVRIASRVTAKKERPDKMPLPATGTNISRRFR
jgi:5-methylcytosine-specific restriction protein A